MAAHHDTPAGLAEKQAVIANQSGKKAAAARLMQQCQRQLALARPRGSADDDPRFADHTSRGEHQAELDDIINAWTRTKTNAEVDAVTLEDIGIVQQAAWGCGPGWHPTPWGRCAPNWRPRFGWRPHWGWRRHW